ncbi:MAG: hypothetical protein COB02_06050 [Candidatus Cloacimonadota bacterium]|nr:MAG: hypothetical protein COB02_12040 [Candidatus Cloacimonadota bacterium]PCJ20161.1 MAG: hypothetical protein COB02_06050 [Candidatus Cloacimonadota bacterium]
MMRVISLVAFTLSLFFLVGCGSDRYNSGNVGVGVSGILNEYGEVNLKEDLDASLLPSMLSECYKEAAQQKKKGNELQSAVVRSFSQKIREISTVDLNDDGTADPILVIPEGNDEQMTFSIRVPDPNTVKTYPPFSDAAKWEDIAKNKAVELVALTAVPEVNTSGQMSGMKMEARPSNAFYSDSHNYQHNYRSNLLTYMIMRDMFFRPSWYGRSYYGWYGGYYRPYSLGHVRGSRRTTVTRYSSGKSTYGRLRTSSGKIPSRSKSSKLASKKSFSSANNVRSKARSGGFGKSSRSGSKSSGFGRSSSRASRSSKSSSRGWFSSRSSSGGSRWGK